MARVLITGATEGLGRAAASELLENGHEVIAHARNQDRVSSLGDLVDRGAKTVMGDLSDINQTRALAEDVNQLGRMDAIIHNAGIASGPQMMAVNVVAPYLLTALLNRPERLIYLSSSMHYDGRPDVDGLEPDSQPETGNYSDSKLFVTVLSAAIARLSPQVYSNAVDPGWVPTRMGGSAASDDLALGHVTQAWLATSNEPKTLISGGYWHHLRRSEPHPSVNDEAFQDRLLEKLYGYTGVRLNSSV